jgi:hypothetical protein
VNNSGASLSRTSAVTDGEGNAVTIYRAGNNNPTVDVVDAVQAIAGNVSGAIDITRTGGASVSAYKITVGASLTTLTADDGSSVITANVKNSLDVPVSGVTVSFSDSGIDGTLTPGTAVTDSAGNAVTTFKGPAVAVATGATTAVTASVSVGGNNYSAAVIITYP